MVIVPFALAACLSAAAGEVDVGLELEYDGYLQCEPVMVFLKLHNDTAAPLVIAPDPGAGADTAAVTFEVKRYTRNRTVDIKPSGAAPVVKRVTVHPNGDQEILADISMFYGLATLGRYSVTARVEWFGRRYQSPVRSFEVVRGIDVAHAARTVPEYPDRLREYDLRYWTRRGAEYLFLTVSEEDGKINCGVFPLGRIVRMGKPVLRVDRDGNVVVVHQSGRNCLTRSAFTSTREGVRFVDQTYHLPDGGPYPFVRGAEGVPAGGTNAASAKPPAGG